MSLGYRGFSPFIYSLHLFYPSVECYISEIWDHLGDALNS